MERLSFGARRWAILIFGFLAAVQLERGALLARHSDPSGLSDILQYFILLCLLAYWLDVDSRSTRALRVWDMGFFLYVAWPLILPYYLTKTRGIRRTLLTLLLLTLVNIGALFVGITMFRLAR